MLKNAVIHIANEQPMMVDLLVEPSPSDTTLLCRNMRTMSGKKPVFVDQADSTFVIPIAGVRFVEIPKASSEEDQTQRTARAAASTARALFPLTEDSGVSAVDVADAADRDRGLAPEDAFGWIPSDGNTDPGTPGGDGLDNDLLRRVRDA